jgi:hypothetical protein
MRTFREKYRRIPIDFLIGPTYEGFSADGKLVILTLILSPRQTQPGIYEGTIRSLAYETGVDAKRLKAALAELENADLIETLPGGGWWVKPTFAWQNCNESFERGALRVLKAKWADLLPRFREYHASSLGRKDRKNNESDTPPCNDSEDTVGTPGHTESSYRGQGSGVREQGSETDAGGRGHAGEGGGSSADRDGPKANHFSLSSSNPHDQFKGNGKDQGAVKGKGNGIRFPSQAVEIFTKVRIQEARQNLESTCRHILDGELDLGKLNAFAEYLEDEQIIHLSDVLRKAKEAAN